jgi:hypothetical protein
VKNRGKDKKKTGAEERTVRKYNKEHCKHNIMPKKQSME